MSQPSLTSYPPSGRTLEFFVADDRRYLWVWLLRTMPCLRLSVINLQWSIYFQGLGEANRTYDGVPAATMLTSPVAAAVPGRPFVLAAVSAAWRLFSFMLAFNSRNWLSIPVVSVPSPGGTLTVGAPGTGGEPGPAIDLTSPAILAVRRAMESMLSPGTASIQFGP